MKAVILGTDHQQHETDPHTILRDAGVKCLQRLAGYIPQKMPVNPLTLPSVSGFDQQTADAIMSSLCGHAVHSCNRRAPYLMLAWLLMGSDNEFRVAAYAAENGLVRFVTLMLLRCALGEPFPETKLQIFMDSLPYTDVRGKYGGDIWYIWADETIEWIIWVIRSSHLHADRVVEALVWSATRFSQIQAPALIQKQAKDWCHIDDDEALLMIQWLFLDALNAEDAP